MRTISFLLTVLLAAQPAVAATLAGYAVKIDGTSLYVDLGTNSGLKTGSNYNIAVIGEELKHPVTGESLGADLKELGLGRVTRIEEKYSILKADGPLPKAGDKIKLSLASVPAPKPIAIPAPTGAGLRASIARSPMLGIEAVDISVGDTDGDGSSDVVLAGSRLVDVYDSNWKRLCRYENNSTATRIMAVESEDVDGDGRAEVFAVVQNKFFKRMETLILDCKDGKFEKRASLPFMVRSFHDGSGLPILGMQKIGIDEEFMGSPIYRLGFSNGKYAKTAKRIKHKRLDWLYGFGFAIHNDKPILLTYSKTNRIRVFFSRKGSWSTPEKFGQTAERIKIGERDLKFHPRLIIESGDNGLKGVYSLSNKARFFQMASAFGQFNRSEIHHLRWNGLALETDWKGELTGYGAGVAERSDTLLIAVVGASGQSSVWTFQK